jgi:site-specific DNA-methyltransferase (adenine-specific)
MEKIDTYLGRIIEGDCRDVMKDLPAGSIDLILCDLPYGTTVNPWDNIIDLGLLWKQYERIIRPNGVIALTAAGNFTAKLIMSNLDWFKYKIVWIKSKSTNFLNAKKQPLRKHEDICVFYKCQPLYVPQMIPGEPYNRGWRSNKNTGCYGSYKPAPIKNNTGERYPYDILFFEEQDADDWFYCKTAEHEPVRPIHPSQKPVDLGRYLIRTYTRPGDIILDNACGSGSFLVAAIRENRRFIGIEKNQGSYHLKTAAIDFIAYANERTKKEMIINNNGPF